MGWETGRDRRWLPPVRRLLVVLFCLSVGETGAEPLAKHAPLPAKALATESGATVPGCLFAPYADVRFSTLQGEKGRDADAFRGLVANTEHQGRLRYEKWFRDEFPRPRLAVPNVDALSTGELLGISLYLHRTVLKRNELRTYLETLKRLPAVAHYADESTGGSRLNLILKDFSPEPLVDKYRDAVDLVLQKRGAPSKLIGMVEKVEALPPIRNGRVDWSGIWQDRALLERAMQLDDTSGIDFAKLARAPLSDWPVVCEKGYGKLSFLQTQLLPHLALLAGEDAAEKAFPGATLPSAWVRRDLLLREAARFCREKSELHPRLGETGGKIARLSERLRAEPPFRGLPVALRHYLALNPQLLDGYLAEAEADGKGVGARRVLSVLRRVGPTELFEPGDLSRISDARIRGATLRHFDELATKAGGKIVYAGGDGTLHVCDDEQQCAPLLAKAKSVLGEEFPPALDSKKATRGIVREQVFRRLQTLRWPEERAKLEALLLHLSAAEGWKDSKGNPVTPGMLRKTLSESGMRPSALSKQWMSEFAVDEWDCEKKRPYESPPVRVLERYRWATDVFLRHPGLKSAGKSPNVPDGMTARDKARRDAIFLFELDHEAPEYLRSREFLARAQGVLDDHIQRSLTAPPLKRISLDEPVALRAEGKAIQRYVFGELAKLGGRSDEMAARAALVFLLHLAVPGAPGLCPDLSPQWRDVELVTRKAREEYPDPDARVPLVRGVLQEYEEHGLKLDAADAKQLEAMPKAALVGTAALVHHFAVKSPETLRRLVLTKEGARLALDERMPAPKKDAGAKAPPLRFVAIPPGDPSKGVDSPANVLHRALLTVNEETARDALRALLARQPGFADTRRNLFDRLDELAQKTYGMSMRDFFCRAESCSEARLKEPPAAAQLSTALRLVNLHLMAFRSGEPLGPVVVPPDAKAAFYVEVRAQVAERERLLVVREGKHLREPGYWGMADAAKLSPGAEAVAKLVGAEHVRTVAQDEVKEKALVPLLTDILHEKGFVDAMYAEMKSGDGKRVLYRLDAAVDDSVARIAELTGHAAPGGADLKGLGPLATASIALVGPYRYERIETKYYGGGGHGPAMPSKTHHAKEQSSVLDDEGASRAPGLYRVPLSALAGGSKGLLWRALGALRDEKGAPDVDGFKAASALPGKSGNRLVTTHTFDEFVAHQRKLEAWVAGEYPGGVVFKEKQAVDAHRAHADDVFDLASGRATVLLDGAPKRITDLAEALQRGKLKGTDLAGIRRHAPDTFSLLVSYFQLLPEGTPGRALVLASRYPASVLDCDRKAGGVAFRRLFDQAPRTIVGAEWARDAAESVGSCAELKARLRMGTERFYGRELSGQDDQEIKLEANPYSGVDHDLARAWLKQFRARYLVPITAKGLTHSDRETLARAVPDLTALQKIDAKTAAPTAVTLLAWYAIGRNGPKKQFEYNGLAKWHPSRADELTYVRGYLLAQLAAVRTCLAGGDGCKQQAQIARLGGLVWLDELADPEERGKAEAIDRALVSAIHRIDEVMAPSQIEKHGKTDLDVEVEAMGKVLAKVDTLRPGYESDRRNQLFRNFVNGHESRSIEISGSGRDDFFTTGSGAWVHLRSKSGFHTPVAMQIILKEGETRTPLSDLLTGHGDERWTWAVSDTEKERRIGVYLKRVPTTDLEVAASAYRRAEPGAYSLVDMTRFAKQPPFIAHLLLQLLSYRSGLSEERKLDLKTLPLPGRLFGILRASPKLRAAYLESLDSDLFRALSHVDTESAERKALQVLLAPGSLISPASIFRLTEEPSRVPREIARARLYAELQKLVAASGFPTAKLEKMSQKEVRTMAVASLTAEVDASRLPSYIRTGVSLGTLAGAKGSTLATQTLLMLIALLEEGGDTEVGPGALELEVAKGGIPRWSPVYRAWSYLREQELVASHYDLDPAPVGLKVALVTPPPLDLKQAEFAPHAKLLDRALRARGIVGTPARTSLARVLAVTKTKAGLDELVEAIEEHRWTRATELRAAYAKAGGEAKKSLLPERSVLGQIEVRVDRMLKDLRSPAPKAIAERQEHEAYLYSALEKLLVARGIKLPPGDGRAAAVRAYARKTIAEDGDRRALLATLTEPPSLSDFAAKRGTSVGEELTLLLIDMLGASPEGSLARLRVDEVAPKDGSKAKTTNGKGLDHWLDALARHGRNLGPEQRIALLEHYSEAADRQLKHIEPLLTKLRTWDAKANGQEEFLRLLQRFDPEQIAMTAVSLDKNGAFLFGNGNRTMQESRAFVVAQLVETGKLDVSGKAALIEWVQDQLLRDRLPDITAMLLKVGTKDSQSMVLAALEKLPRQEFLRYETELREEAFALRFAAYRKAQIGKGAKAGALDAELALIGRSLDFLPGNLEPAEIAARAKHADLLASATSVLGDRSVLEGEGGAPHLSPSFRAAEGLARMSGDGVNGDGVNGDALAPGIFVKVAEEACKAWEEKARDRTVSVAKLRADHEAREKQWLQELFKRSRDKKVVEDAAIHLMYEKTTLGFQLQDREKRRNSLKTLTDAESVRQASELDVAIIRSRSDLKLVSAKLDTAKLRFDEFGRGLRTLLESIERQRRDTVRQVNDALMKEAGARQLHPFAGDRTSFFVEAARKLIPKGLQELVSSRPFFAVQGRRLLHYCSLKEDAGRVGLAVVRSGKGDAFREHPIYRATLHPSLVALYGLPLDPAYFDSFIDGVLAKEKGLAKARESAEKKLRGWGVAWDGSHQFSYENLKLTKAVSWNELAAALDEQQKHMPLDREQAELAWLSPGGGETLSEGLKSRLVEEWADSGFPPLFEVGKTAVRISGEYPAFTIVFEDREQMRTEAKALARTIHLKTNELVNKKLAKWSRAHNNFWNTMTPWGSTEKEDSAVKTSLANLPTKIAELRAYGRILLSDGDGKFTATADMMARQYAMQHKHDTLFSVQHMASQIGDDVSSMQRQFWVTVGITALATAASFVPGAQVVAGPLAAARLGALLHLSGGIVDSTALPLIGMGGDYRWAATEKDLYISAGGFAAGSSISMLGRGALAWRGITLAPHSVGMILSEVAGVGLADWGARNISDSVEGVPVQWRENFVGGAKTGATAMGADQILARRFSGFARRFAVSFMTLHFGVTPAFLGLDEWWHGEKIAKQASAIDTRLQALLADTKNLEVNQAEIEALTKEQSHLGFWPKLFHAWVAQALPHSFFARNAGAHGRSGRLHEALGHPGRGTTVEASLRAEGIDPSHVGVPLPGGWVRRTFRFGRSLVLGDPYHALAEAASMMSLKELEGLRAAAATGGVASEPQRALDVLAGALGFDAHRLAALLPRLRAEFPESKRIGEEAILKRARELVVATIRAELAAEGLGADARDRLLDELSFLEPRAFDALPPAEFDLERETHRRLVAMAAAHYGESPERLVRILTLMAPERRPETWERLVELSRRLDVRSQADLVRLVMEGVLGPGDLEAIFPEHAQEVRASLTSGAPEPSPRLTELGQALTTEGVAPADAALRYLAASLFRLGPTESAAVRALLRRQLGRVPSDTELDAVLGWMRGTLAVAFPKTTIATPYGLDGRLDRNELTLFQGRVVADFLRREAGGKLLALGDGSVARALGVASGQRGTVADLVLVDRRGSIVVLESIASRQRVSPERLQSSLTRLRNTALRILHPARTPRVPSTSVGGLELALPRGTALDGHRVSPTGQLQTAEGRPVRLAIYGTFRDVRVRWVE